MQTILPSKDPNNIEPYFIIWCDIETGLNDGSKNDHGELQGSTIDTATWFLPETIPPELIKISSNENAVTIAGIDYDIDTVCTIWVSGGTGNKDYRLTCRIHTFDERTLEKSIIIPVREN